MQKHYKSLLIVVIQFSSILYLAFTGSIIPYNKILLLLEIIILLFGFWAMIEMKFRFNILPELLRESTLVMSGPYKFVRHPMYAAIIVITLTWIFNNFSLIRFAVWIVLVIILNIKIEYEEKFLSREFSAYEEYKLKSKKLIPFIY